MLVSIFKCRLWMAWESRLWEDLIYFAAPENSGKTVQGRRLILLPEQPQKMVFVQVLWSSHNICNNLQASWLLNIKVEESTRSWLFFARTVFFQNWAPRKSHFLHSHTLVQLQTLFWCWISHINEIERWCVLRYRVKFWMMPFIKTLPKKNLFCRRNPLCFSKTALSCWTGLLISSNCWG